MHGAVDWVAPRLPHNIETRLLKTQAEPTCTGK